MTSMTLLERLQNIQWHLNHDAYLIQMHGRNKPIKQFIPCSRAIEISKRLDRVARGGDEGKIAYWEAIHAAALFPCGHANHSYSEAELMALEYKLH